MAWALEARWDVAMGEDAWVAAALNVEQNPDLIRAGVGRQGGLAMLDTVSLEGGATIGVANAKPVRAGSVVRVTVAWPGAPDGNARIELHRRITAPNGVEGVLDSVATTGTALRAGSRPTSAAWRPAPRHPSTEPGSRTATSSGCSSTDGSGATSPSSGRSPWSQLRHPACETLWLWRGMCAGLDVVINGRPPGREPGCIVAWLAAARPSDTGQSSRSGDDHSDRTGVPADEGDGANDEALRHCGGGLLPRSRGLCDAKPERHGGRGPSPSLRRRRRLAFRSGHCRSRARLPLASSTWTRVLPSAGPSFPMILVPPDRPSRSRSRMERCSISAPLTSPKPRPTTSPAPRSRAVSSAMTGPWACSSSTSPRARRDDRPSARAPRPPSFDGVATGLVDDRRRR